MRSARGARWVRIVSLLPDVLSGVPMVPVVRPVGLLPMPLLMVGLDVTAGLDVTVGGVGVGMLPMGVVVVVVVEGDVIGVAAGVVGVVGVVALGTACVSRTVLPEVVDGVVDGVVMGVDGGVVDEFCATAKPPPSAAMTAAEVIKS